MAKAKAKVKTRKVFDDKSAKARIDVATLRWAYGLAMALGVDSCGYADDLARAIAKGRGVKFDYWTSLDELRQEIAELPTYRGYAAEVRILERLRNANLELKPTKRVFR